MQLNPLCFLFLNKLWVKADSEPSESDGLPTSKSERPRKPKKKRKKPLEDVLSEDVDLPGEGSDPTQAGYPDQNPEKGPGLKDSRKPRKKSRPSNRNSDPKNVPTVVMNYVLLLLLLISFFD